MYGYNGQILKIVHFPAYLPRTGDIRLTYGTIAPRKNEVLSVEIIRIGYLFFLAFLRLLFGIHFSPLYIIGHSIVLYVENSILNDLCTWYFVT